MIWRQQRIYLEMLAGILWPAMLRWCQAAPKLAQITAFPSRMAASTPIFALASRGAALSRIGRGRA